MENTKFNGDKNSIIVKKVAVPETLRNIPYGTVKMHFLRKELTNKEATVNSAVSRLNHEAGFKEFSVEIDENDGSYLISRAMKSNT